MMNSPISFPSLGLTVDPARYISIGPLRIYVYGCLIAAGLLLAVCYGMRHADRAGMRPDDLLDGVLWVTPFAIVCARLYYVAFRWESYASNPVSALYIWEGGLAIFGGVLGAAAGTAVFCRRRKLRLRAVLDLVLTCFLIGQCIGRWGNFFNREAFGAETDSFLRMGLTDAAGTVRYYHPAFLYESVWNLAGFLLLHSLYPRRRYDGQIALGYCAWYGLGRAFIEGLRTDSLYWGGFRVSQVLAAVLCVSGITALLLLSRRSPSPDALIQNRKAETAVQPCGEQKPVGKP